VAREDDVVAFVEVKARGPGPEDPLEAVRPGQRRRILRAARAWIHDHPGVGSWFRFDVVAVALDRPRRPGGEPSGRGRERGRPGGPETSYPVPGDPSREDRVVHVRDAWFGDR
jgi:Holliday junction resolvase-like predicted endonuclease